MWDIPRLLMAAGGLGMLAVGVRKKDKLDVGIGACFVGSALFGYLSRSNDMYSWLQLPFALAMLALCVAKIRAVKKR